MARDKYLVGIDAGSSKVCASAGCVDKDGSAKILAVASGRSRGLKNGMVVDLAEATESVKGVVEELEDRAGIKVRSAIVGMGGDHIHGQNTTGVITVPDGEIRGRDMRHAMELAQTTPMPLERRSLHVISQGFVIDGLEGVADPRQMHGTRLEARLHIITVLVSRARNISRCIHGAGLMVESVVFSSLASSYSVLTQEEKRLGITLVDLGGGTTNILSFADGKIKYTEVIPWGGDTLTETISRRFKVNEETAEMLKERYGSVQLDLRYEREKIYWHGEETECPVILRGELTGVIRTEIEELLKKIKDKLDTGNCTSGSTYGLVLTGGTSVLDGVLEFAEEKLGLPVRLGLPRGFESENQQIYNPGYAGSLGLLRYSAQN
ncbi:MAG: cell division protein FtsA, partial [Deltaproteobacteria bacterium]|nr:cell division protein FtsA [Deltaproteobacteria bacterium]